MGTPGRRGEEEKGGAGGGGEGGEEVHRQQGGGEEEGPGLEDSSGARVNCSHFLFFDDLSLLIQY